MLKKNSKISIFNEPLEFFRERVVQSLQNQHIETHPEIEFYLVSLLVRYMQMEAMKESQKKPLALQYQKALLSQPQVKIQLFKELGDFALYVSGFFADSLSRQLVDVDYYMNMGGIAYKNLANLLSKQHLHQLYEDLANRFSTYVDVLAEVSEGAFSHSSIDILRLYEKWLKTKSERLEKLLMKEGLFPIERNSTELN
ncbi:MAG: hypothetical protein HY390_06390 [Deltaproteobacteria bacterium]|nr:hypothetical protein [Deltaproteobacteria bacterium]